MIYVFLADGFEEIEALTPVDILRRAGLTVQTVGVTGKTVTGNHQIPVVADVVLSEVVLNDTLQAVILPGGLPGATKLDETAAVQSAIDFALQQNNCLIGAICAAPFILGKKGILDGKNAICYPGFENQLSGAAISASSVCRDGNIITAKGMGVATEFALAIASALAGDEAAEKVRAAIQFPR